MFDVPLRQKDALIGVLCVEHAGDPRTWTVDERNSMLSVANLVVVAHADHERRAALRRLAESEARTLLIVDTAHDAFIGMDHHGRTDVLTMDQWMTRSLEGRRTPMILIGVFGAAALALSAIGIYGVLAFGLAQRVREFGIRQALGADRRSILALVLKQGLRTAGLGLVVGLGAAVALTRYLESLLFGVQSRDLPVFAGVSLLLFLVSLFACYVPAHRATRISPLQALREG